MSQRQHYLSPPARRARQRGAPFFRSSRGSRNGCSGAADQRRPLSPPICGGFASAICRCWVRGWGSGRAQAKARAPSSRPTPRHFSITEKKEWPAPPNLTSARLPNSLIPKHRGPTLASASGGRSLQCGSRRRYRHPEPNRLCDLACAAGGSVSAHSEASTETVPRRRPIPCPPLPAKRASQFVGDGLSLRADTWSPRISSTSSGPP